MDVIKDFHFGELEDGSVQLSILYADKTHRTGIVAPELLGAMLGTLMKSMFHAKDPGVRKWAQMMAIRTVSGRVEHGLATLTYELEAGVEITSTLPADSARALSAALAKATVDPSARS